MLKALENFQLAQQAAGAFVIVEDVLKALASVLAASWEVNNLHNFAVRAPT